MYAALCNMTCRILIHGIIKQIAHRSPDPRHHCRPPDRAACGPWPAVPAPSCSSCLPLYLRLLQHTHRSVSVAGRHEQGTEDDMNLRALAGCACRRGDWSVHRIGCASHLLQLLQPPAPGPAAAARPRPSSAAAAPPGGAPPPSAPPLSLPTYIGTRARRLTPRSCTACCKGACRPPNATTQRLQWQACLLRSLLSLALRLVTLLAAVLTLRSLLLGAVILCAATPHPFQ